MKTETYVIQVVSNRKTGLMIAMSDDLPGLYVHGRNEEELDERIPAAIRALLEANGEKVGPVSKVEKPTRTASAFMSNVVQYKRELQAA